MSTIIKPDYTCFTIRKKNRVIAVLVEAKLTKHKKIADVTAQVCFYSGLCRGLIIPVGLCFIALSTSLPFLQAIGYHIAFASDGVFTQLVIVITKQWIQMVLFPFQGFKGSTIYQPVFVSEADSSSGASESGSQLPVQRQTSDALVNAVILPKILLWESYCELSKDVMWLLVAFSCPDHAIEKVKLPGDISSVPKRKVKGRILTFTQSLQKKVLDMDATIRQLREQLEQGKVFPLCLCSCRLE